MMTRTLSAAAALALTAGTLALSTPVHAASGDEAVSVSYGDLDLATATGKAQLDRRIRRAATEVCGTASRQPLNFQVRIMACQKDAAARAKADVETALARNGNPVRVALRAD